MTGSCFEFWTVDQFRYLSRLVVCRMLSVSTLFTYHITFANAGNWAKVQSQNNTNNGFKYQMAWQMKKSSIVTNKVSILDENNQL